MVMHAIVNKATREIAPSGSGYHIYSDRSHAHDICGKVNLVYGEGSHEVKEVILATPL